MAGQKIAPCLRFDGKAKEAARSYASVFPASGVTGTTPGPTGSEGRCGWNKDRYGIPRQIVPDTLPKLLSGPDHTRAARVMGALTGMTRLDVTALEAAAAGKA